MPAKLSLYKFKVQKKPDLSEKSILIGSGQHDYRHETALVFDWLTHSKRPGNHVAKASRGDTTSFETTTGLDNTGRYGFNGTGLIFIYLFLFSPLGEGEFS